MALDADDTLRDMPALGDWLLSAPVPALEWHTGQSEQLRQWCEEGLNLLLAALPPRSVWGDGERRLVRLFREAVADARAALVAVHGEGIYSLLTRDFSDSPRIDALVTLAATQVPGLLPTPAQLSEDAALVLNDKLGHELSVGLVLAQWLAQPRVGRHLMASMRLPLPEAHEILPAYQAGSELELGLVRLQRRGRQGYLSLCNPRYLNAEDDDVVRAMELAIDVVLLDGGTELGVLRGGIMLHQKYRGRRVFCSGVNLTKLYSGQLPFLFYIERELGLVSKLHRGLWGGGSPWADAPDLGLEKPWVAAVDGHAIGGGCQLLLVCDHVIAESSAFISLPARSEGFIPGVANLRLPQYVGRRLANRLIYRNHKVAVDSIEGRLLVDEVVGAADMDVAIDRIAAEIVDLGSRGIVSNRKAFRHATEPLDQFRGYLATFCREQARCMYGTEIIRNLEQFWTRRNRS
ncbi:enoyl-CoA hydratase/isomerase family protein [Pandoraea sp. XY-2]|uniref:enoyl-CoA hydratase/isomerase family protein n=1 Tax=Pandoraea sp. XY-2 TaxID=2518599 RepID=UPI00101AFCCD|nr:enoyl-CoA hydratase/isomerase family protein [Pandoraea sp. XY-2]QBC31587.1 enoyl-CoA hydratase/isomerase family protein [Pandoraea sp. XY-2]